MRLYNGAPDSALKKLWDNRERLRRQLPQGAHCTHFPAEGFYQVWQNRPHKAPVPISGEHSTPEAAMEEVLRCQSHSD